jgi:Na+/H+ antiporter NhaD/arsenite permease-like protein
MKKTIKSLLIAAIMLLSFTESKAAQDSSLMVKNHADSLVTAIGNEILPVLKAITGKESVNGISYTSILQLIALFAGIIVMVLFELKHHNHNKAILAEQQKQTQILTNLKTTKNI